MEYEKWIELLSMHLSDSELDPLLKESKEKNKYIGLKPQFETLPVDFYTLNMLTLVDSPAFLGIAPSDFPIRRSSSTNQGEFGYSPEDQLSEEEMAKAVKELVFDESKRIVQPPIEVPDIKVNGEVVESVTFHPHVNPLMFTLDFGIKGEKPE